MTRFQPLKDAPPLPFDIPIVTPELIVPQMLRDVGPLMKLWRRDLVARAVHLQEVEYHVGFDLASGATATLAQPLLLANRRDLPA